MDNFNVQAFDTLIDNIISCTNKTDTALKNISKYIDELKTCINQQENAYLYQSWNSVKLEIDTISRKYYDRKEEFLSNLMVYKKNTLAVNDEVYRSVQHAMEQLEFISRKMDSL